METFEARLASFSASRTGTKKGQSKTKWPHKKLSPTQLAKAGFFFQPTTDSPDNTTCYLCEASLDGWEEDDDPIEEHLKHAPHCGWVATIALEQTIEAGERDVEDPMGAQALNARLMTFGSTWPHESKRGWICKTQKLAESGWYYCPSSESDDLAKCAYCNLSLDGWEPKDDPFQEHQKRSPDCLFFSQSSDSKPGKSTQAKSKRVSKAARASTISMISNTSDAEVLEEPTVDEASMLSTVGTAKPGKAAKGGKKAAKAKKGAAAAKKSKASQVKQEESAVGSSFVEPEDDDFEVKVPPPRTQSRGQKRRSEEMTGHSDDADPTSNDAQEPAPAKKRRATKTRKISVAKPAQEMDPMEASDNAGNDTHMTDAEPEPTKPKANSKSKKGGKQAKTRASAAKRKTSTASVASKASLRAGLPDDEEIEAALEEDLDRPLTDDGSDEDEVIPKPTKTQKGPKTAKKNAKKGAASTAPTRRATRASSVVPETSNLDFHSAITGETVIEPTMESPQIALPKQRRQATRKPSIQQEPIASGVGEEEESSVHGTEVEASKPQKGKGRAASRQVKKPKSKVSTAKALDNEVLEPSKAVEPSSPIPVTMITNDIIMPDKVPAKRSKNNTDLHAQATKSQSKLGQDTQPEIVPDLSEINTASDAVHSPAPPAAVKAAAPRQRQASRKASRAKPTKDDRLSTADEVHAQLTENVSVHEDSEADEIPNFPAPESFANLDQALPSSPPQASGHSTPIRVVSPEKFNILEDDDNGDDMAASTAQSSDVENQPPSSRPSQSNRRSGANMSSALKVSSSWQNVNSPHHHSTPKTMTSPSLAAITMLHDKTITPSAAATAASPSKGRVALAVPGTPTSTRQASSPSKGRSKLESQFPWKTVDIETIFSQDNESGDVGFPTTDDNENAGNQAPQLTSPETRMNVEEWIRWKAGAAEEKLRLNCERLVGRFEGEGVRALRVLEGIECVE